MTSSVFQYLGELREHEHLSHFYYNDTECYEIASRFLSCAIKSGMPCVVVSDRKAPYELTSRLEGNGYIVKDNSKQKAYEEIILKNPQKLNKRANVIVSELKQGLEKILKKSKKPLWVLMMHSDLFYFLSNNDRLWKKAFLNKICLDKPIVMLNQYPLKKISSQDLISIMKTHHTLIEDNRVYQSPLYISPETIIEDFDKDSDSYNALSSKEQRVLALITNGLSNSGIAEELSLSVKTVETHRANIMKKLDIHNLVDLVKFSMRNGIA